jgi:hypothetical protein
MLCKSCGSKNQKAFDTETSVYRTEFAHANTPPVLIFPKLLICLDCGFIEGQLSESESTDLNKP